MKLARKELSRKLDQANADLRWLNTYQFATKRQEAIKKTESVIEQLREEIAAIDALN